MSKTNKKKILYIHHGSGIGGAPLSLLFLIRKLDRSKYDPIVLCLHESEAADLYRKEGIETFVEKGITDFSHTEQDWYKLSNPFPFLYRLFNFIPSIYKTYKFVKKISPDIVHLNSSTLSPSAIGSKLAGSKVVWHIREPLSNGYFGLRRYAIRKIIHKYSDKIIAICKNDADKLMPSDKIKVVYNFVDFKEFDRNISGTNFRREFDLDENTKAVGMLGGVLRIKGTFEFLKSLKKVKENIKNVKYFVIGSYPSEVKGIKKITSTDNYNYFKEIKSFLRREGLEEDVIFTGVRLDIPEVIAGLDLIVFPSIVPHFARPIIEAGAMAKPVVASNLEGPQELIEDGETGILVDINDPDNLARAIIEILSNEETAKKMGEAGYKRAREMFNADVNVKEIIEVYEEFA